MTEVQISKWGNSSAIRLSKAVLDDLGVKAGERVRLTVEDGRGIIEPVRSTRVTLDWILSETRRLGPENAPETVDWGRDRGSEVVDDSGGW